MDLHVLPEFVRLTTLCLWEVVLDSLELLGGLTGLVKLTVYSCTNLTDVRALANLRALEELELSHNEALRDLSPLNGLPALRVLKLFGVGIRAVPPLAELPALRELDLMCTEIHSLDGIEQGRQLRRLSTGPSNISDLRPLAALSELEYLHLDSLDHKLEDLGPLRGLPLRDVDIGSRGLRDLSPLGDIRTLQRVQVRMSGIESVAPLAGLPELRCVDVGECDHLESVQPLAACPKLESLTCDQCDRLRGPKSLEELRRPPTPPPKRFPSAGVSPPRGAGTPAVFDARNHLPRVPPEGWSMPERSREDKQGYFLEAEGITVALRLTSRDGDDGAEVLEGYGPKAGRHLVVVYLAPRDRKPAMDKKAARVLRRFRACDAFVETKWEGVQVPNLPWVRCFVAFAHPASPETWAAMREEQAPIRIEPAAEASARSRTLDLRNHLPEPLPEGWRFLEGRDKRGMGCNIDTPLASLSVVLETQPDSDAGKLAVGVFPLPGAPPWVSDDVARSLLAPFRARSAFEERTGGPYADAPGLRLFVARAN
jgi:hypothetical protein